MTTTTTTTTTTSRAARIRSIVAGSAGNLVEWYDWYVYSAFALYFAKAFFSAADPTAKLLGTAAVFAVGFLMRPLGGWVMGIYADRHGRKAGLTLSVLLMSFGSMMIACTPRRETIGLGAPIMLVIARLLQGLSLGGEYGASATYLSEIAERDRRGLWASLIPITLSGGQLIALLVLVVLQLVLSREQLESWGWRIPFAIGGVLALAVWGFRRGLIETASFEAIREKRSGALMLIKTHPREALVVVGLTAGGSLAFYAFTTYMQKFLVVTASFDAVTASRISAAGLVYFIVLQPTLGWLSDRIGRRPVMIGFGVLGATFTVPLLTMLGRTRDPFVAFALVAACLTILSGYTSINALVKAEMFPAEIRALGVALPFALSNAVFGGSAEYVALWFKAHGLESGFFWYVAGGCLVSLLVFLRMRDTRDHSLIAD